MAYSAGPSQLRWDHATSVYKRQDEPQGLLVPDVTFKRDQVAVVYNRGDAPPEITIKSISDDVHTVMANGVAIAVIAQAAGPMISADDVLLVEGHF